METTGPAHKTFAARLLKPITDLFGLSRAVAIASITLIVAILVFAVFWFFHLAPPDSITITSGPAGSAFQLNAEKYAKILERNGVKLKILASGGSQENLDRLRTPSFKVDIGFVQGGITNEMKSEDVLSLGSVAYEPLLVFYRGETNISLLADLKGKRLAIGSTGSGTRTLSLALLKLNGIEPGGATGLLASDAEEAAKQLKNGEADAVFLTTDSASPQLMRKLLLEPEVHLLSFAQADAYTRRVSYLNRLELPMGSLDFGLNVPRRDIYLVGPTVELLARRDLHPALCDLLLEAAREVHGGAGLLKKKGEFPAPLEHEYPISSEALRFYKSGKGFLYRTLPFWVASVINRVLVVFVPVVVVLIPGIRLIPTLLGWKTKLKIYRWYRALLHLEHDLRSELTEEARKEAVERLDDIERSVNGMKVPASFADQFYGLRGHIGFVRARLMAKAESKR
jgi:TRAP transporter TAXI family solute receptor